MNGTASRIDVLESRIVALEGKLNRRRGRLGVVLLASLCAVACAAAYDVDVSSQTPRETVVRAKRFEVVDDQGRVMVVVGTEITGDGLMVVNSRHPSETNSVQARARIVATREGGSVQVLDAMGETKCGLLGGRGVGNPHSVYAVNGSIGILSNSGSSSQRVYMGIAKSGGGTVRLFDGQGTQAGPPSRFNTCRVELLAEKGVGTVVLRGKANQETRVGGK